MEEMVMQSDPYHKENQYFWIGNGSKEDVGIGDTFFGVDEAKKWPVSHIAYKIFDCIKECFYNEEEGMCLSFEGTEDDYRALETVLATFFPKDNIKLAHGEREIKCAKDVIKQIERSFNVLEEYFKDYPDPEMESVINKYQETVKEEIVLCVMGLYSSGKSAFINSLIGREILPSADNPETARIYKIRASAESSIRFSVQNQEYTLTFDGSVPKVTPRSVSEIIKLIQNKLEEKKPETESGAMYWTLAALNEFGNHKENREKLADMIEIHVPFDASDLPKDYDFVIYDTPGSDSAGHKEHLEVLREAMEEQTNGLPIIVAKPDSLDKAAQTELDEILDELDGKLDLSNMLIVVNRCDDKIPSALQTIVAKREEQRQLNYRPARVYFVSSIIGLGGKKERPLERTSWFDQQYYATYKDHENKFKDKDDDFYLDLPTYNILPEDEKEELEGRAKAYGDASLLWNSGIPCVAQDIGGFAKKYALYNKCLNAIGYLTEAAGQAEKKIENAKEESENLRRTHQTWLDDKKKELISKLEETCKERYAKYTTEFVDQETDPIIKKYTEESRIRGSIDEAQKKCGGKIDVDNQEWFLSELTKAYQEDITNYAKEATESTEKYWAECTQDLKDKLLKIVYDSDALTKDQKKLLADNLMETAKVPNRHDVFRLALEKTDSLVGKIFRALGQKQWAEKMQKVREDKGAWIEQYRSTLKENIAKNNLDATTMNEQYFKEMRDAVIGKLQNNIISFNPELKEIADKLAKYEKEIDTKNAQISQIEEEKRKIEQQIAFQKRSTEGQR